MLAKSRALLLVLNHMDYFSSSIRDYYGHTLTFLNLKQFDSGSPVFGSLQCLDIMGNAFHFQLAYIANIYADNFLSELLLLLQNFYFYL